MSSSCKSKLNWLKEDYFRFLLLKDNESKYHGLELLVEDLNNSKLSTLPKFLCHSGSEDFIHIIFGLLHSDNPRIAGNAAYVIGTIAENEAGCVRIMSILKTRTFKQGDFLFTLTNMLSSNNLENIMNAAGTLGTLVECPDGREWVLASEYFPHAVDKITNLLVADNVWIASNAALVLARLSVSDIGCEQICEHENSALIVERLIDSLGVDEAGRGMNAAFAIGRMADNEIGVELLSKTGNADKFVSKLSRMLKSKENGCTRNSCFCLSCLTGSPPGHSLMITSQYVDDVITQLLKLISSKDEETAWFAAMTLRTLAGKERGCEKLRTVPKLEDTLIACLTKSTNSDLSTELQTTLDTLKPLVVPEAPTATVTGSDTINCSWNDMVLCSGFKLWYILYCDNRRVYSGPNTDFDIVGLSPFTTYSLELCVATEIETSDRSEILQVTTDESTPSIPTHLRVLATTTNQIKIVWEPPTNPNGALKNYFVHRDDKLVEQTTELSCIMSGLNPEKFYAISVCASTSKGKGECVNLVAETKSLGEHAPEAICLVTMGRQEIQVTWDAPSCPLGRITRYEVVLNGGKTVYSGIELGCRVKGLASDTEYAFTVVVVTNVGRCESKTYKKRTAKDEYGDAERPPLYEPIRRDSNSFNTAHTTTSKAHSSVRSDTLSTAPASAKEKSPKVEIASNSVIKPPDTTAQKSFRRVSLPSNAKSARPTRVPRVSSALPTQDVVLDRQRSAPRQRLSHQRSPPISSTTRLHSASNSAFTSSSTNAPHSSSTPSCNDAPGGYVTDSVVAGPSIVSRSLSQFSTSQSVASPDASLANSFAHILLDDTRGDNSRVDNVTDNLVSSIGVAGNRELYADNPVAPRNDFGIPNNSTVTRKGARNSRVLRNSSSDTRGGRPRVSATAQRHLPHASFAGGSNDPFPFSSSPNIRVQSSKSKASSSTGEPSTKTLQPLFPRSSTFSNPPNRDIFSQHSWSPLVPDTGDKINYTAFVPLHMRSQSSSVRRRNSYRRSSNSDHFSHAIVPTLQSDYDRVLPSSHQQSPFVIGSRCISK